jgi:hypothetical protein
MSSQKTGYTKNVSNFKSMVSFCLGYGTDYQPSQDVLKVANLQTVSDGSANALSICTTSETAFNNAVNARQTVFMPLKPLATRIVNAFAASGVDENVLEGAESINNKIQGKRSTPKSPPKKNEDGTEEPSDSNSVAQQGVDEQVINMNKLVELVSSKPEYAPNEFDLKVSYLQTYLTNLEAANNNVKSTTTVWSNDRISRDVLFYADKTGLFDISKGVKKYAKSAFGPTSPKFKQISGLRFTKPAK